MIVTKQSIRDTNDALEELAYEICNNHFISGEAFYTMVSCFAEAKVAELQGELA